jgi:hypothetical protein
VPHEPRVLPRASGRERPERESTPLPRMQLDLHGAALTPCGAVSTDRTTRPCAFGAFLLHMIHCTPSSRRQMTSLYP